MITIGVGCILTFGLKMNLGEGLLARQAVGDLGLPRR